MRKDWNASKEHQLLVSPNLRLRIEIRFYVVFIICFCVSDFNKELLEAPRNNQPLLEAISLCFVGSIWVAAVILPT